MKYPTMTSSTAQMKKNKDNNAFVFQKHKSILKDWYELQSALKSKSFRAVCDNTD